MHRLREQLATILQDRVAVVGVGNVTQGDDGFGVRLAERLREARWPAAGSRIVTAGLAPERVLPELRGGGFAQVLFLDAVEFGGEPGAVILLDSAGMSARWPQVSTHKLSLGLLAHMIEAGGPTQAWLLGVQPESLAAGAGLSPKVQATAELLTDLFAEVVRTPDPASSALRPPPSAISC
jgi:hydrogenase 3 maturation protease